MKVKPCDLWLSKGIIVSRVTLRWKSTCVSDSLMQQDAEIQCHESHFKMNWNDGVAVNLWWTCIIAFFLNMFYGSI